MKRVEAYISSEKSEAVLSDSGVVEFSSDVFRIKRDGQR